MHFGDVMKRLFTILAIVSTKISKQGIEMLVQNCPALEYLDLSECQNVNDYCVELIAVHLKRLSTLKLANCALISEVGLSFLSHHCKNLKV